MTTDRQAVRDALQSGYGDATQSVLDDRVAGDVIASLRGRGWFSPSEVAAIVLAAGGEVTVKDEHLRLIGDERLRLYASDDYAAWPGAKKLQARVE